MLTVHFQDWFLFVSAFCSLSLIKLSNFGVIHKNYLLKVKYQKLRMAHFPISFRGLELLHKKTGNMRSYFDKHSCRVRESIYRIKGEKLKMLAYIRNGGPYNTGISDEFLGPSEYGSLKVHIKFWLDSNY